MAHSFFVLAACICAPPTRAAPAIAPLAAPQLSAAAGAPPALRPSSAALPADVGLAHGFGASFSPSSEALLADVGLAHGFGSSANKIAAMAAQTPGAAQYAPRLRGKPSVSPPHTQLEHTGDALVPGAQAASATNWANSLGALALAAAAGALAGGLWWRGRAEAVKSKDIATEMTVQRSTVLLEQPSSVAASGLSRTGMGTSATSLLTRPGGASAVDGPRIVLRARSELPSKPTSSQDPNRRGYYMNREFQRGNAYRKGGYNRQLGIRVNRKTSKPIPYPMHVVPGDLVQVMKGKDKGKVTRVISTWPMWNRILCWGTNYCIKHVRPAREDQVGQRVQVEAPIDASWVMHYDPEEKTPGLLGIRWEKTEVNPRKSHWGWKKVRYNKATGNEIQYREAPEWKPVADRTDEDDDPFAGAVVGSSAVTKDSS